MSPPKTEPDAPGARSAPPLAWPNDVRAAPDRLRDQLVSETDAFKVSGKASAAAPVERCARQVRPKFERYRMIRDVLLKFAHR
jgi:hypothetical protein